MAQVATAPNYPGMIYRRLGNSGLYISAVSLGGWVTFGGHVDEEGTFDCMKKAFDLGINFFDTAESYSQGESEVLMGKAIKKYGWNRNDLVISTKVYFGGAFGSNRVNNFGLSRKHIVEGTLASLRRLDLDYVDIIYAHRPDRLTPMEEVVRGFNYLIDRGLAFYWGTSMWSADEIAEASAIAQSLRLVGPVVEQPVYNALQRVKVEEEYARVLPKFGIGLTVWSPLKQGILTGKYNDAEVPPAGSRLAVAKDMYTSNQRDKYGNEEWVADIHKVKQLKPVADRLGTTLAILALAWCLKNEHVTSVITGASRPAQVEENVKSLELLPKLTPEVLEEIDQILGNKPAVQPARFGW